MQYRTRDGDMVDWICHRHYGPRAGATEAVYAANRGLAALGPVLPANVLLELPALPAETQPARIRLWD